MAKRWQRHGKLRALGTLVPSPAPADVTWSCPPIDSPHKRESGPDRGLEGGQGEESTGGAAFGRLSG